MNISQHPLSSPMLNPCTLSKTGWLAEQPADFQERIVAHGRWRTYRAGESLYEHGDEANAAFGLEDGLLDILIPISDDEMVNLHRARPGFWIGDSAFLSKNARVVSVTAHAESLVFAIPARALQRHLAEHPEDMIFFYKLNHANMALTLQAFAEVVALPPRARFARMLLRLASSDGLVQATQTELGEMIGMSRAAFRRAFSGLIAEGIVRTEYGKVRIVDRAALEAKAARR